ncbi:hypothetical protein JG687_00006383 [Phytophthora cactorum]|uniref:Uncharacterized protein n=1 Tax=Phytophthora cactorum TaxID=29920 RepID=A0A8T1UN09_9STRA|nr:hypothetical protein JG687_00006383 [Phytophthora cactorum]
MAMQWRHYGRDPTLPSRRVRRATTPRETTSQKRLSEASRRWPVSLFSPQPLASHRRYQCSQHVEERCVRLLLATPPLWRWSYLCGSARDGEVLQERMCVPLGWRCTVQAEPEQGRAMPTTACHASI